MNVMPISLEDSLHLEFDLARFELVEARRAQQHKNTPAGRQRLAECRARVDSILDAWNDAVLASA